MINKRYTNNSIIIHRICFYLETVCDVEHLDAKIFEKIFQNYLDIN